MNFPYLKTTVEAKKEERRQKDPQNIKYSWTQEQTEIRRNQQTEEEI